MHSPECMVEVIVVTKMKFLVEYLLNFEGFLNFMRICVSKENFNPSSG